MRRNGSVENLLSILSKEATNGAKRTRALRRFLTIFVALRRLQAATATAMSAKANTLSKASGGTGNPTALYNQGVILWNQGKGQEALPLFEQAITADPNLADAHYMLGMVYVSMDKKPEAIKALEAYLKLAPTGENAATAKAVLAQIK